MPDVCGEGNEKHRAQQRHRPAFRDDVHRVESACTGRENGEEQEVGEGQSREYLPRRNY
jgi:hypothetical protein